MANNNDPELQSLAKYFEQIATKFGEDMKIQGTQAAEYLAGRQEELGKKRQAEEKKIKEETEQEIKDLGLQNAKEIQAYIANKQHGIAMQELQDKLNNQKKLAVKSKKQLREEATEERKLKSQIAAAEARAKGDEKGARKIEKKEASKEAWGKLGAKYSDAWDNAKSSGVGKSSADTISKTLSNLTNAINNCTNAIGNAVDSYGKLQKTINTRLQGTGKDLSSITEVYSKVAFSPLISAETLYSNLDKMVEEGVSFNVEQRAFLQTIKDGVATTFDANDPGLRKLIKIQQEDSTAARLGMESYLTKWLNEYTQTTEYLTSTFDTVAQSLLEASSMLGANSESSAAASAEFEYVVQKWLGTLSGFGFDDSTITSIASAINAAGSGDVSNLGSSGIQNLLMIAASKAGLDYANILSNGLNALDANTLMLAMTQYMQELSNYDNNVVKNQLAQTFGLKVTDLVAVKNLGNELDSLYKSTMSYSDMYEELSDSMESYSSRVGLTTIMDNLTKNLTYQTGMGIASNPVSYFTWKLADLVENATGGINIPFVTALGSGIDLNATVTQLMKLGLAGGSVISQIGGLLTGINSIGDGSVLLDALSIQAGTTNTRGSGLNTYTIDTSGRLARTSGITKTSSTYVGTSNYDDYYNSTVNAASEDAQETLSQMKAAEDPVVTYLKEIKIESDIDSIKDNIASIVANGIAVSDVKSISAAGFADIAGFYKGVTSSGESA